MIIKKRIVSEGKLMRAKILSRSSGSLQISLYRFTPYNLNIGKKIKYRYKKYNAARIDISPGLFFLHYSKNKLKMVDIFAPRSVSKAEIQKVIDNIVDFEINRK